MKASPHPVLPKPDRARTVGFEVLGLAGEHEIADDVFHAVVFYFASFQIECFQNIKPMMRRFGNFSCISLNIPRPFVTHM
ncbi:MAG: hypothetical protein JNL17_06970 [Cyclobacteriaceae bacterium]|nr:hypothetical protein [Cyclobacteriaceae bacterium]